MELQQPPHYRRDKQIVMAIIKYVLYAAIAFLIVFFVQKIFFLLIPFLIGFLLANSSRHIANGLIKLRKGISAKLTKEKVKVATPRESKRNRRISFRKKHPVLSRFLPKREKTVSGRTVLAVIIYVVLLLIVFGLIVLGATALVIQINNAISNITNWIAGLQSSQAGGQSELTGTLDRVMEWIAGFSVENGGFLTAEQMDAIRSYIGDIPSMIAKNLPNMTGVFNNVVNTISSTLSNLPMMLFSIIVILMSGFYFLTDQRLLIGIAKKNIRSRSFRHRLIKLVNELMVMLFRVLGGYTLLLLITFVESYLLFLLAGVQYALVLALITAVLDFMPVLGVSATIVPLMIYEGINGNFTTVFILFLGWLAISIVRRLLEPPILGSAMKIHPMATLFSMIIGVAVWGPIGFMLGPVAYLVVTEGAKAFEFDKRLRLFFERVLNKV